MKYVEPVSSPSDLIVPRADEPTFVGLAARRTTILVVAYAISIAAYVVLCMNQPVQFNSFADKDDAYFLRVAQSILDGEWFGDYDQMTLIKGGGFAYFLALNHLLGLPVTLSLTLVFVASCVLLARVVSRCLPLHRWAVFVLFLGLMFQPALMPTRILRDHLYHSLFLLALAGMITLTMDPRRERQLLRCFVWGLPVGLFWITREEGIWVIPAFGLLVLLRTWRLRTRVRSGLLPFGGALVAFAVGASLPVLGTSAVNQSVYGAFVVTDMNAAPFQSAMRSLDMISSGDEIPRVLVSRQALRDAYAVSPALAELSVVLDDPDNLWLGPGCGVYPNTCGEFAGGWFGWAVRDAAFAAGRYSSASEASRFFEQIASELGDACEQKELTCSSGVLPLGPVVSADVLEDLPSTMFRGVQLTTYGQGATQPVLTTVGTADLVAKYRAFLGDPRITTAVEGPPVAAPENASKWVGAKQSLADVYSVAAPIALVLGLLSFIAGVALVVARRRVSRRMLAVAGMCWILYVSRLGLVSLIDLTSSPGIVAEYLQPAFLALWVAAFLSIAALVPLAKESTGRLIARRSERSVNGVMGHSAS